MLNIMRVPKQIEHLFESTQDATRNVSGLKQAGKDLRESQRYLSDIIQVFPDATMVIDRDGKVVAWNRAMEEFTGVTAKAMLGKGEYEYALPFYGERRPILINLVTQPDADIERTYARTERRGNTLVGEGYMQNMHGEEIFLHGTAAPLHNSRGEIVGAIESICNITERRRAEEGLIESECFLSNILDSIDGGISILDEDLQIIRINSFMEQFFVHRQPIVGRKCYDVYHSRTEPCESCPSIETLESGQPSSKIYTREKNGEKVWMELSAYPFFNPAKSHIAGVVEFVRDITERKRAEENRLQLEARLLETQKLESLTILAGGVAHDFNNILTAIIGYTQLARQQGLPGSPCDSYLSHVEEAAGRAAQLADQMLAFSGKGRFHLERIGLSRLVETFSPLLPAIVDKPVELRYVLAPDIPTIEADLGQLRQVIVALVTNAVEAIGGVHGVITLRTGVMTADRSFLAATVMGEDLPEGEYVFLDVADSGGGIATDIVTKIFDPFFSTKFAGRGLGLAAVHGIMRGHHGTIMVENRPGEGTTFTILFPCAPAPEMSPAT